MATTYELIASQVLGSDTASVTFSSIPGTYDDLVLKLSARSNASGAYSGRGGLRFNADTGSNYSWRMCFAFNGSIFNYSNSSQGVIQFAGGVNGPFSTANTFGNGEIFIPNYAGSSAKSVSVSSVTEHNGGEAVVGMDAALWTGTSAITSIQVLPLWGTLFYANSSFYLFGVSHA